MCERASFYSTLTAEERTRTHPCKKTRCVIMSSGDSSPPPQASISSSAGFDVLDDARLEKVMITPVTSTKPPSKPTADAAKDNTEEIEEAVPIVQKTLPTPEPKPEIEKNGFDVNAKKSPNEPDDACLINCIYYTQQCCDCTIV
ncbi:uncharacterized protein [Linepithema humile]|uniref:uncharacterized protein isoform X3 n=1 Tax=Linepithema humile TaxID=83485 RepID=UPI000623926F|nr:PREDICTED: uncharacterized protein LOC105669690 isoform X3 [Linepithema humile]XP_012218201.1 PREDICTED: uncharacterized protein LOC105669690 isoform X3 [Linepithema humile]XP_012218202.1 PREDICTED: uncharacterized protein LOC105669690 isoform X3 [Linepithema humile]